MKDISKHVPKMQDVGEKLRIVCCDIICQVFDCDKVFLVSKADQMVEEEEAWEYIWSDMFWERSASDRRALFVHSCPALVRNALPVGSVMVMAYSAFCVSNNVKSGQVENSPDTKTYMYLDVFASAQIWL